MKSKTRARMPPPTERAQKTDPTQIKPRGWFQSGLVVIAPSRQKSTGTIFVSLIHSTYPVWVALL